MPVLLCGLEDIPDGESRAFSVGEGDWPLRGFIVRRGERVFAYENRCPHAGHALNMRPHEFLTPDGTLIQCRSHGALFAIETGECVAGPCAGRTLRAVPSSVDDSYVHLDVREQDFDQ